MKHDLNTLVKVTSATDDTFNDKFMGMIGTVIDHDGRGGVGNTKKDPLHRVEFDNGLVESFWYEELTPQ